MNNSHMRRKMERLLDSDLHNPDNHKDTMKQGFKMRFFMHTTKAVSNGARQDCLYVVVGSEGEHLIAWVTHITDKGIKHPKTLSYHAHSMKEIIQMSTEWGGSSDNPVPTAFFKPDATNYKELTEEEVKKLIKRKQPEDMKQVAKFLLAYTTLKLILAHYMKWDYKTLQPHTKLEGVTFPDSCRIREWIAVIFMVEVDGDEWATCKDLSDLQQVIQNKFTVVEN